MTATDPAAAIATSRTTIPSHSVRGWARLTRSTPRLYFVSDSESSTTGLRIITTPQADWLPPPAEPPDLPSDFRLLPWQPDFRLNTIPVSGRPTIRAFSPTDSRLQALRQFPWIPTQGVRPGNTSGAPAFNAKYSKIWLWK